MPQSLYLEMHPWLSIRGSVTLAFRQEKEGFGCFGMQRLETDPLLENLDGLLPLTLDMPSVGSVPTTLPSAVEDLCAALMREPGIDDVSVGRQVPSSTRSSAFVLACIGLGCIGLQDPVPGRQ